MPSVIKANLAKLEFCSEDILQVSVHLGLKFRRRGADDLPVLPLFPCSSFLILCTCLGVHVVVLVKYRACWLIVGFRCLSIAATENARRSIL